MTYKTVTVRGHSFTVDERGEGAAVVLLHGFTGDAASMTGLAQCLPLGRKLILPDLIGHGGSAVPEDPAAYEFTESAEQVFEIVAEFTSDPFDVIGYSMGGRLALQLAVSHPDRVRSVCLIGASPGIADRAERHARLEADADLANRIETDGIESFVKSWESQPLFASQTSLPDDVRRSIRSQRLSNDTQGLALTLRGSGTGSMSPLYDDLARGDVAMCWITGELDTKFTRIAAEVSATNNSFESVTIHGAGHAAHVENPAAVSDAIAAFWAGLGS